jgi:hypothetical protein
VLFCDFPFSCVVVFCIQLTILGADSVFRCLFKT